MTYHCSSPKYTNPPNGRSAYHKASTVSFHSFLNPRFHHSHKLSVRGRVPKLGENAADAFLHNSLHYSTARFKIEPSTPVSEIAYQNRQALKQALDPKDIERSMTVVREMVRRNQSIVICEPFERFYHVTSWTSAWRVLDFSSVVKRKEGGEVVSRRPKLLVLGEGRAGGRELRRCELCRIFNYRRDLMIYL